MEDDVKLMFGKIWPAHVGNLVDFLINCRKSCDGDLDMFLVLAVIGDQTFSQRHADETLDYKEFMSGHAEDTPTVHINLRSIERYSGIPRETTRRKIDHLIKLGWVKRKNDGSLVATAKAKTDLEPLTMASIKYIADMMQLFAEASQFKANSKKAKNPGTRPGKQTSSRQ